MQYKGESPLCRMSSSDSTEKDSPQASEHPGCWNSAVATDFVGEGQSLRNFTDWVQIVIFESPAGCAPFFHHPFSLFSSISFLWAAAAECDCSTWRGGGMVRRRRSIRRFLCRFHLLQCLRACRRCSRGRSSGSRRSSNRRSLAVGVVVVGVPVLGVVTPGVPVPVPMTKLTSDLAAVLANIFLVVPDVLGVLLDVVQVILNILLVLGQISGKFFCSSCSGSAGCC